VSEDRSDGEMAEAAAQPFFESQTSEQRLEEDDPLCQDRCRLP
jgi:hypothetical protein